MLKEKNKKMEIWEIRMVRSPDLLWGRRGVVLKALKKGWERWEIKMLGREEGLWERLRVEDEDGGLWERLRDVRKVERWEMKMRGCVEMKIVKHGWWLGFWKYLAESKLERREDAAQLFLFILAYTRDPFFEPAG
jgi:hypothetical protein